MRYIVGVRVGVVGGHGGVLGGVEAWKMVQIGEVTHPRGRGGWVSVTSVAGKYREVIGHVVVVVVVQATVVMHPSANRSPIRLHRTPPLLTKVSVTSVAGGYRGVIGHVVGGDRV